MKKRMTVYPHPRALEILGSSASDLNRALAAYAEIVANATATNAETFRREEWMYLADMLNGHLWEPGFGNPGELLAIDTEDANRLDGLGPKWFGDHAEMAVAELAAKLRALDYAGAQALVLAVEFFWSCPEVGEGDDWWTIPFRRERRQAEAAE